MNKATASPEIPKTAPAQLLTIDKLPTLSQRLVQSIAHLRLVHQAPERQLIDKALKCENIATAEHAAEYEQGLVHLKRIRRAAESHYDLLKKPFNFVRQTILGWEGEDVGELDKAEKRVSRKVIDWRSEQARIEAEKQRAAQAQKDEEARLERERQVEALKNVALAQEDPDLAEALEVEALSLADAPIVAETAQIESEIPITPGLSFTKRHKIEIVGDKDLLAFVKAIGAKKVPLVAALGLVVAKDDDGKAKPGVYTSPWLNDQAKANAGDVRYPGCTVREVQGATGR